MQSQSLNSLWSISTGKPVLCVSSSKDGGQIAVGTTDACLVLDAAKGCSRVFTSDADNGPVTVVAFAREGHLLTGGQGTLRLWDVPAGKVLATLELGAKQDEAEANEAVFLAAQPSGELFGVAAEHGRYKAKLTRGYCRCPLFCAALKFATSCWSLQCYAVGPGLLGDTVAISLEYCFMALPA